MEANTARWAQIIFWERGDLQELHRRESLLEASCENSRKNGKRLPNWKDESFIEQMAARNSLVPYWPAQLPVDVRDLELKNFERAIYPIWASIFAKADKDAKATEQETVHRCDLAIFDACDAGRIQRPIREAKNVKREQVKSRYDEAMR